MDWWEIAPPGTLSGTYTNATTLRMEAEDYTAKENYLEEQCADVSGTSCLNVMYQGAWADYRITAPVTGTYNLRLRIACVTNNTVLQIKSATGVVLATINVPNTGGNGNYTTQSYVTLTSTLYLPAGEQTLRVQAASPYYSLNRWELELPADADNQSLLLNNSSGGSNALIYDSENNFTMEFWVKPYYLHEIDVESTGGYGGTSGQRYVIFPGHGGDGYGSRAGAGISVGTNGVSVYEHADGYLMCTIH